MPRITTPKSNTFLRREYKLRFFSVFFMGIAIILAVHVSLALSSYMLLSAYEKTYSNQDDEDQIKANQKREQFVTFLDEAESLSTHIISEQQDSYSEIFETINMSKPDTVELNVFEIFFEEEGTQITLRGVAQTRQGLVDFGENMKRKPSFRDFVIPFETLTRQSDLPFDITFTYYEN